jgi:uncharacterized protein (TIGR02680 family)
MTNLTTLPTSATRTNELDETPAKQHPNRWCLNRGGIVNVWYYFDSEFSISGGRIIWRGTNGAGKSRALEMLLPFVLDADRRKMDATGAGKVRLEDLMKAGGEEQPNRLGYLWLELVRVHDNSDTEYLTLGALVRFSRSTAEAKAWYFTTPLRVGVDLELLDQQRMPLARDKLADLIGGDRITDSPEVHRERVRSTVFVLTGESGRERYAGLLQLLHTLRAPDVGNRIEEGKLPAIVSEALPPLSESALNSAGEQLDALSETRAAQERLDEARVHVVRFLDVYRRYTAGVLSRAAGAARAVAAANREAENEAQAAAQRHDALTTELATVQQRCAELEEAEGELAATISGIKESKEYADARGLDQREQQVKALARAADGALQGAAAARQREADVVDEVDSRARDVVDAAGSADAALRQAREQLRIASVPGTLPAQAAAVIGASPTVTDIVRAARDDDPAIVRRPVLATVELLPADLTASTAQVRAVKDAAEARAGQAAHRVSVAKDLAKQREKVDRAEERADEAEDRAREADQEATESATHRDDEAVAIANAWRQWAADGTTTALLGHIDWEGTPVGMLLVDVQALVGDDGDAAMLSSLDTAAEMAASPARDRLAERSATLNAAQADADRTREALQAEQAQLHAACDREPHRAPWHNDAPEGALPLWRAIDFAAALPTADRAGIEAALHASGLLTASLSGGTLTAGDGQVLVAPTGPVAASPLTAVLCPDPASPADPAAVIAVLERIAFGDRGHQVWVDRHGTWGNGPLTGRHRSDVPRHIGAQARAAARAARLKEIESALADLNQGDQRRAKERRAIGEQRETLSAHLRTAPRTSELASLRSVAAAHRRRADGVTENARALRGAAQRLRTAWHDKNKAHEMACASARLPTAPDELADVRTAADMAARACDQLIGRLAELSRRAELHRAETGRVRNAAAQRAAAEEAADRDWQAWQRADAEFAALSENVGRDAARVRAELRAAENQHGATIAALRKAREDEGSLRGQVAAAEEQAKHARSGADSARAGLFTAGDELRRIVALPGVTAAACTDGATVDVGLIEITPAAMETAARSVETAVDRRGSAADENALIRAQQALERDLSGTFDVLASVAHGVRLVELADATGRRHLADAAADLTRRAEEGRSALSERERRVFTDFVLGGVAEELRRRLGQASLLIEAVNASLATIRTSHGVGVRVRWNLTQDAGNPIARIRELVTLAGEVRTAEQTAELTDLIKDQVNSAFAADATAGYATHLKTALDYRTWHEVGVIILGPAPGQERKISRRAKLSQGEIRFVSYVTLFAAVDAYLSGLPDTTQALRLILLDDAFAKVDDRTIGQLMGLLVRLDIDFAMTGHALWGCYPQVPALDVYEVRRRDGTAAVTTHVHWDGRTRHLRAAR